MVTQIIDKNFKKNNTCSNTKLDGIFNNPIYFYFIKIKTVHFFLATTKHSLSTFSFLTVFLSTKY